MATKFTETVSKLIYLRILRRQFLNQCIKGSELSWEYVPVLEYIRQNPGCIQVDIANKLKITPAAVTQSTKKMEHAGFIEKKINEDNLRIKQMYITDKGVTALGYGTEIFDKTDNIMFDGFTDEDVRQLGGLLDRINKNIAAHNAENIDEKHLPWEI